VTIDTDIAAGRLTWASQPRLGGTTNEDHIGMVGNAVWVLDGAGTSPTASSCCDKDARWYVERLDAALIGQLRDDKNADLQLTLGHAIEQVQNEHAAECPDATAGRGPSSTVAIARRRGLSIDLLVLGDSTILLDHGTHVSALRDTRLASISPTLRHQIMAAIAAGHGYGDAEHDRRRAELVHAERLSRNRAGGYWIAADQPAAADHALTAAHQIGTTPPNIRRLLLMTDGAQRATSLLALYDSDQALLAAAAHDGPEACIRRIRAAEAADPTGRRYPRTKRSDDTSLIVWDLIPP
jgi:hypothetical protein